jgi:hypothetical protein
VAKNEPGAEAVGGQTEQREQIADFFALEQASEMKHGDAAGFERARDLAGFKIELAADAPRNLWTDCRASPTTQRVLPARARAFTRRTLARFTS